MPNLIWILILFFVISCSSGKQVEAPPAVRGVTGTMQPGAYALEISPKTAARDETVNLIFTGFGARDAKVEWLLNGGSVESVSPNQFKLSGAKKGDILQAKARVHGREILSNTVEIVNALPKLVSVKLLTDPVNPGDTMGVAATGNDADGDTVTFRYEWTINGEPAGNEDKIGRAVKRGDRVSVKVAPFDGESFGNAIVLDRVIQNSPPIIQEHSDFQFDGTIYTYQVKASDPDGDTLTYALESAEEGMMVNKSSGLLTWKVPAEFNGGKSASIVVTDGQGGTAKYVLNITIK